MKCFLWLLIGFLATIHPSPAQQGSDRDKALQIVVFLEKAKGQISPQMTTMLLVHLMGIQDNSAGEPLVRGLRIDDPIVRFYLIQKIGNLKTSSAIGPMESLFRDQETEWWLKSAICLAWGRIGHQSTVPFLVRALNDKHPMVRKRAVEALENIIEAKSSYSIEDDETSLASAIETWKSWWKGNASRFVAMSPPKPPESWTNPEKGTRKVLRQMTGRDPGPMDQKKDRLPFLPPNDSWTPVTQPMEQGMVCYGLAHNSEARVVATLSPLDSVAPEMLLEQIRQASSQQFGGKLENSKIEKSTFGGRESTQLTFQATIQGQSLQQRFVLFQDKNRWFLVIIACPLGLWDSLQNDMFEIAGTFDWDRTSTEKQNDALKNASGPKGPIPVKVTDKWSLTKHEMQDTSEVIRFMHKDEYAGFGIDIHTDSTTKIEEIARQYHEAIQETLGDNMKESRQSRSKYAGKPAVEILFRSQRDSNGPRVRHRVAIVREGDYVYVFDMRSVEEMWSQVAKEFDQIESTFSPR